MSLHYLKAATRRLAIKHGKVASLPPNTELGPNDSVIGNFHSLGREVTSRTTAANLQMQVVGEARNLRLQHAQATMNQSMTP